MAACWIKHDVGLVGNNELGRQPDQQADQI
jgi:hypothetical protein